MVVNQKHAIYNRQKGACLYENIHRHTSTTRSHDEIPMNATYKTWVIFTGNSPVLVLICTIAMTFTICTADHLIQILILMTVKSFLMFTTCLKKCPDTTYICLLINITHGRHIFQIHSTHMKLMHTQQTADFWASMHTHQAYYVLMNTTHHTHTFLFHSTPMMFWYI